MDFRYYYMGRHADLPLRCTTDGDLGELTPPHCKHQRILSNKAFKGHAFLSLNGYKNIPAESEYLLFCRHSIGFIR